ncbi:RbsD/FucU domain-containing protein [Brachybacterium phenoliresistens]|uniref:RbsD/FucU domain-containing protein n=1 Tax=Brachybacterium phenoliresistens TaxID=396014 RepID=UPI0006869FF9|nr:RbsD/FucU domain-containing protein [Brachybacterium phenoliresistens]
MTLIRGEAGIIHPDVLEALARVGHKGRILVADALYSTATIVGPRCRVVHIGLCAGYPTVPEAVRTLHRAIALEEVCRMLPESGRTDHDVHREVDALLPGAATAHSWIPRGEFYAAARSEDVALCLATGDVRRFANVLLTVGGVRA